MSKMPLKSNFQDIGHLLLKNLNFISQDDSQVINGERIEHPWLDKVMKFSESELENFDALRDHSILDDKTWIETINSIKHFSNFSAIPQTDLVMKEGPLGKKKKQHELKSIHDLIVSHKLRFNEINSGIDFGGGVGNLSKFLQDNFNYKMTIIEKDHDLIKRGREKTGSIGSNINFVHHDLSDIYKSPQVSQSDFGIGLHTCGNFANNMIKTCIANKIPYIYNWGCCYSKIENDEYNLSNSFDIKLNQRALSAATLSFSSTNIEQYRFRIKIMDYKYSFYHWLFSTYGEVDFIPMGNSRASLYDNSFAQYVVIQLQKYYPGKVIPKLDSVELFFNSIKNINLLKYFKAYYAITRYIGELAELYILHDRAIYLIQNGYEVEINNVFDNKISARNKLIFAIRKEDA